MVSPETLYIEQLFCYSTSATKASKAMDQQKGMCTVNYSYCSISLYSDNILYLYTDLVQYC